MYALIKREIQDHIAYFIGAAVFSAVFIIMTISILHNYDLRRQPPAFLIVLGIPSLTIVIFGICAMGSTQMYLDRSRKISALLSTLAVSRNRILLARIITGILVILTLLVPLFITALIFVRFFSLLIPFPMFDGMVFEISLTVFLMAFSCYCIGLQTGWNSNPLTPSLGALGLTCILLPLIIVKGFGPHIVVILVLFIVASLIRTWHTFMTTSL